MSWFRFGDNLVQEDDNEELKAQILNNYTAEAILDAFGDYQECARCLEVPLYDEEDILETEDPDLLEQIGYDPDDYIIPERDYPEYPHEI